MTPSEKKYWSRTEYKKRIQWYNEDIKLCLKGVKKALLESDRGMANYNRQQIKSLRDSKRIHTLTFKTLHRKEFQDAIHRTS